MNKKFEQFKIELNHFYRKNKLYRNKMQHQKIEPSDIKTEDDIKKLPLTTKEDLLQDYPYGWFCVDKSKIRVYHASSGTTGKPLVVGLTKNDLKFRNQTMKEDAMYAGITKEDTVQICYGFGRFTWGLSFYDGLKELGCKIIPTGTISSEMQLFYMQNLQTTVLITSPSHVMHLYEVAKSLKIDVKSFSIRMIRVVNELLTESMRQKIKSAWGKMLW